MGHQEQQRQRLQWQQWHQWQEHEHSANIGRQMLLEQQQRERWQWQQELHQQQIEQLAAMTSGEASYSSEWDTQSSHQTSTASRGRRAREARRRQRTDECCELPAGPVLPQKPQDGQFDSQASDATTAASESGRSGETEASTEFKDDEDLSLLIQMEGAQTSQEVLAAAHQVLARLSPETTVAALHLAARHAPATATGAASPHLAAILAHLRRLLPRLRQSRCLSRLAWTLGKLEVRTPDVEAAVCHICAVAPQSLQKFTSQDLTNTLWGLARLFPAATDRRGRGNSSSSSNVGTQVARLADSIIGACSQRVQNLTAQCLSNALWAAARIGLRGPRMEDFLWHTLQELQSGDRQLAVFTPQGLANMLWAIAELKAAGVGAGLTEAGTPSFEEASREACAMVAGAAASRVHEFQHQELSMMAWAMAKLHGRGAGSEGGRKGARRKPGGKAASGRPSEIDQLMLSIAGEAHTRLSQLSPQSVSNLAWALATMDLSGPSEELTVARDFLCSACEESATKLGEYSPQAVANLLWAAVRIELPAASAGMGPQSRLPQEVHRLAGAAAKETTLRMLEFSWRDLAGVAVAVSHRHLRLPEALTFATLLVGHAAVHCGDLTPQLMLNIAQSCVRIGVPVGAMQGMVDSIQKTISERGLSLNEVDTRQWREVLQKCPPSTNSAGWGACGYGGMYSGMAICIASCATGQSPIQAW
ncbi:unnamed protein product [Polarella glacialis]|uniref:RAP domain-containing protein n=1 Tax=Polarella glacialis TaxID=89957 RepID=A0A813I625_POLGL|nr:unnamed protein product [Polarella glacialis]